ncbi:hypothetical protein Barb4_01170 [Bacteroidales bacterium Barb4]|nr:hypothetical protein Barb4_01170 [Bacteroidales bacterium Barb4]
MKSMLSVFCSLLICNLCFSQEKITGIGKLKLFSSANVIKEIGYIKEPILVTSEREYLSKVYKKYENKELYLLGISENKNDKIARVPFCDSVKVYYIPSYIPVDGVVLSGITLKFFNDSLYSIMIDSPDGLRAALTLKYGKPEHEKKEKERIFVNGLGIEITKIDSEYTTTWEKENKEISCYYFSKFYHSDKGELNHFEYFSLFNVPMADNVEKIDKENTKKIIDKEENERRKKLDVL